MIREYHYVYYIGLGNTFDMSGLPVGRRKFLLTVTAGSVSLAGCATDGLPDSLIGSASETEGKSGVWNVEDYGIDGDGTANVGQAVHDLLDMVDQEGGGTVYFPPGRYLFERTPLVGDDTLLMGAGRSTVFEGVRPDDVKGRALLSNKGYDATGYDGASNWGVSNIRIDSPDSNGILPAHTENVRLENIYGDAIYYHHIDIVSSKNVVVDGYWATRGGEGGSDAPFQFDNQNEGTTANGIQDGEDYQFTADDDTPVKNCTLRNFEIDPENDPEYGVHIHRDGNKSIKIQDGYITGCQHSAIRGDTGSLMQNVRILRVSCIDNARGISIGHVETGRRELTISDVTIRTNDRDLASGSGLYASGFTGGTISNTTVDGEFTNTIIFDDMSDLKMSNVTARGAEDQAFRFRENVDVTLTNARAANSSVGIYSGNGSTVAYGGVTFENVEENMVVDGELREWVSSERSGKVNFGSLM